MRINFNINIELNKKIKQPTPYFKALSETLYKQTGYKAEIKYDYIVDISFLNVGNISTQQADNIEKITTDLLEKADNNVFYFSSSLQIYMQENKIPIGFDIIYDKNIDIIIDHNTTDFSLSGIHKFIKKAKDINIYNSDNIISSILGIVLVKCRNFEFRCKNYGQCQWVSIAEKHFNGDKDVLEFQEELIEKGFKQYARL